jgi:predicted RNase H-like HicB family nuclease
MEHMTMRYYVVFERAADSGWGAYPPDLPGVGVVADTQAEAKESIKAAIEMHIAGLRSDGLPVPQPSGEFVEIHAA